MAAMRPRSLLGPQSSPAAHRGARVIGADALRILLISPEPSDGQECNQDNEDNPNINAHQSSPAGGSVPPCYCRRPMLRISAGKLSWQAWPCCALGVRQRVNRLFGKLDCIVLRISGRRRPKPVGFAARDVLAVQAPKVCKPSSGLIFESFNEVTLVFHGTYS